MKEKDDGNEFSLEKEGVLLSSSAERDDRVEPRDPTSVTPDSKIQRSSLSSLSSRVTNTRATYLSLLFRECHSDR